MILVTLRAPKKKIHNVIDQELFFSMYGVASVIATATVLSLLGFVAVCLRFYVRIRITRTFVGIDDWLVAISCFLVLGQSACQIVGTILKPPLTK